MNEIINEQQLSELEKLNKTLAEIQKSMKGVNNLSKTVSDSFGKMTTVFKSAGTASSEFNKLKKSLTEISDTSKKVFNTYNVNMEQFVTNYNTLIGKVTKKAQNQLEEFTEKMQDSMKQVNNIQFPEWSFSQGSFNGDSGHANTSEIASGFDISKLASPANISSIANIVSGILPIIQMIKEAIDSLPTPLKEMTAEINAQKSEWQSLMESRNDSVLAEVASTERLNQLWHELNADDTALERKKAIILQLNDALGVNLALSEEGNLIQNEETASIEDYIQKKRALAIVEALEPGYQQAIIENMKAIKSLRELENSMELTSIEIKTLESQLTQAHSAEEIESINMQICAKMKQYEEYSELYTQTEQIHKNSLEAMTEFENMAYAASAGNYENVTQLYDKACEGFETAGTATEEALKEQYDTYYNLYQGALNGTVELTDENVAQISEGLKISAEEFMSAMLQNEEISQDSILAILGQMNIEANDTLNLLNDTLTALGIESGDISNENAQQIINGLVNGLESKLNEAEYEYEKLSKQPGAIFAMANGISSPSKLFAQYGRYLVEGLNQGLDDTMDETSLYMQDWGSIISKWGEDIALPNIGVDVSYYTPASSVLASAVKLLNLPGFPKVKFNKYALGGLPDIGEIFIARESGPELVGKIGNSPAVMNNTQIVQAVKQGVFEAVSTAMDNYTNNSQPMDITMKVGETQLAKVTVKAINNLARRQGRIYLNI